MTNPWKERGEKVLMEIYDRFDISIVKGENNCLIDTDGNVYNDFLSGIAVVNLGYSNEAFTKALHEQVDALVHAPNYFWGPTTVELAELLTEHSFADQVFFCCTGAEANEGALKLARRYQFDQGYDNKTKILSCRGAFHGRTMTTATITDNDSLKEGFGTLPSGFEFIEFNNVQDAEDTITDEVCAVILEPVQGEGGLHVATEEFLQTLRKKCDETGALLIFDEIQCGMSRTGSLFAYEQTGVVPDIISMAKGLGNGVPIGAVLAGNEVGNSFQPGRHGTTFGGNPISTAAGLATLKEHLRMNLAETAKDTGAYFQEKLQTLVDRYDMVKEVRGRGLMIGIQLDREAMPLVRKMLKKGFIINDTDETLLRFVPPLTVEKEAIDRLVQALGEVFDEEE